MATSTKPTTTYARPLNVAAAQGSKAARRARARGGLPGAEPRFGVLAPGVPPSPSHDLVFHGGKTLATFQFLNFYVGGDDWSDSDAANIDKGLASALADAHLNNVIAQYFPGQAVGATFLSSSKLPGGAPATVSQGDVDALCADLLSAGTLGGVDLSRTLLNFMLPPGTILTTDTAPSDGAAAPHQADDDKHPAGIPLDDQDSSTEGLGGYHGSTHVGGTTLYFAVGVYSQKLPDGTNNGIPAFDQPWKNVVATFFHECHEFRTDADVADAINAGADPSATRFLGWTSPEGEEIGDFPVFEARPLGQVFQEVPLADGSGTVPVQFIYSNAVHGPEGPIARPH